MKKLTTVGGYRDDDKHELIVYRVRVCTRCGHEACPCCDGTWCDACFDWDIDAKTGEKVVILAQCADEQACVYDEPDSEAVEEVSRQVFDTQAEFDAAAALIHKES
jgi:hypothetical protein